MLRLWIVLLLLALGAGPSFAQGSAGKITGVVTDSTGLSVAGAAVQATNALTGELRQAETNVSGVYVLSPLALGDYTLEVRKEGFKTSTRKGLRIDVNSALTVDVRLEVGAVSESVTVQAAAATIETENQAIGNSRYEVQLQNLPIIIREIQALVGQTAGVPYGSTDTVGGNFQRGGRSAMQILSDGVQLNPLQTTAWPAIDGIGRRADLTIPSVDAISEVKWTSNGGSAEYSQPTQVIVASKAGTNEYHGNAYEFYRSGGMGARRWEAANRESFVRHQFGGTAGGPIRKDRIFFFGGADVFRHASGLVVNARHPTAAERAGDLRSLLLRTDAQGRPAPVTVYDPLTAGQPFPNNTIPRNRISPVSVELLKLIPEAAVPGARITDFNAIIFKPQFDNSEKYDARYDHNLGERDRLFARTTIARLDQASRYSGTVPGGDHGYSTKQEWTQAVSMNWTRTVDPRTIGVFQFTFRSMPFKNIPGPDGQQIFPVKIKDVDAKPPFAGPPAVQIQANGLGISDLFDRLLFNYSADYSYSFDPTFTKVLGNHTLKSGFSFLRGYKTTELASRPYGRYLTRSDFNNPRSTTSATGDAYADFLIGAPSTTDVTIGEVGGFQSKTNWHLFAQDDWKITPRLTLNLGLRYDSFGFFEEMNKRAAVGHFATGKILIPGESESLIQPAFRQFRDRYITADQAGLPNTFIKPNRWDFAPRFGMAYRFTPSFVLRGGFGVYYVDVTVNEFRGSINVAPFVRRAELSRSLLISQGVNVNALYTFENPTADSSAAGADTQLTTLDGFFEEYPTQRAYTWNLTLEKDLGGQMGLRTSYVGNFGRHLSRSVRVNACVPGPTECLARAAGSAGARRWNQFVLNVGRRAGDGDSEYHSWEIELQKRFSNGFLFDVNYAYSRLFGFNSDASDPVGAPYWPYDWGTVSAQPNNVFHWNFVYEIPVGKGRRFGSGMPMAANAILGGWLISGLGTWQSGEPLTITTSSGQTPTGATGNRADRAGDGKRDHSGLSRGDKAYAWFDTAAFREPGFVNAAAPRPTRQFGNSGLGVLRGPAFFTYDMTVQKGWTIRETYKLQFRVEVFNPFNTPMLGNPDTNVVSSNFGRIRTSNGSYTPRNIQLGLRLDF